MVHGVDAVGGDVHLEEVAVPGAEVVDALDRDAAQCDVFGELAVVHGDAGNVAAEPFGENVHKEASQQVSELASQRSYTTSLDFIVFKRPLIIRATSLLSDRISFVWTA